jgi:hypothetical protein
MKALFAFSLLMFSGAAMGQDPWGRIESVLTHPRCINCHTMTAYPTQANDRHRHQFGVARGEDNKGAAGLRCSACHQAQNQSSGIPGAPNWHLAPLSQGWETAPGVAMKGPQLCRVLLDPAKNGGMTPAQLQAHLESDPLVQWGWDAGTDPQGRRREPPPVPYAEFLGAVREWTRFGTPCPKT